MNTEMITATALVLAAFTACGNPPDELQARESRQPLAQADIVQGYLHALPASKFVPGPSPGQVSEFGFQKTVGAFGVFATRKNGWALGLPNADAPATRRPPLVTNGEDHDKRVLSYFLGAGLPSEQVQRVNAHATVGRAGATEDLQGLQTASPTLEWYSSVVSRSIQGVPVAESFAVARFNADDEVVSESVFWPAIPASVVADAVALRAQLADSLTGAQFRAKLPPVLAGEQAMVVIHHSPAPHDGVLLSRASYDVFSPGGMRRIRHFDSGGHELAPLVPVPPDPTGGKTK
ncbi:MAG: hypothetical protein IT377_30470 [Polyangiaceae bacterium]|nr:hypothetical protein [Polyangiaceae bacterium]